MDQGLFKKHIFQLKKIKDTKNDVISLILERTGITLEQNEIVLVKKNITLQVSSVKKSQLIQKGIQEALKENGYNLKI